MPNHNRPRIPQTGDALILTDHRRFILRTAEQGARGWWLTAAAEDGRSTLQGNLHITWDEHASAWRPASTIPKAAPRQAAYPKGRERTRQTQ